ncbi:hypothetical protein FPOAC2_12459 [Fusarium poae]|jgi:hypothetical protein|uniref:Uncharacterized protein n=1 Tax=Fusarium poae TaxID=36050 RepID=A0A1B8AGC5_FUSPO|nr:hypothetical protein FPOAC1_012125 [Fusarium poae]KAG8667297.1 hypothetical protein FPOAC1_012125 [Fusarium poae]OBS19525.1 hypothetical protein FPOA_11251 [Fusarium poae]
MSSAKSSRSQRLQMLGTASLPALLIGGLILILVGVNAFSSSPSSELNPRSPGEFGEPSVTGQRIFRIGREWSIQTWIAIAGIAFGLLSFGFTETYIHMFDAWCSRQAQHDNGLDYARYLNSQARAPVRYGLRGYPAFITLRYIITAMGIAVSIGYKFAFVTPEVKVNENLSLDVIDYLPHRMSMTTHNSSSSDLEPWISDGPLWLESRSFLHSNKPSILFMSPSFYENTRLPPTTVTMVGHGSCRHGITLKSAFSPTDSGTLYTRELALAATGSAAKGTFTMKEDKGDWQRIEVPNSRFFNPPQNAIIEYRVPEFAVLQVQWAKAPDNSSGTWEVPVVQRFQYTINGNMALVRRRIVDQNCIHLTGPGLNYFSYNTGTLENAILKRGIVRKEEIGRDYFNITKKMPEYSIWLEPLVKTQDATLVTAISAVVRVVMTVYKMDMGPTMDIEEGDMPFGEEGDPFSEVYPGTKAPFYVGTRAGKYSGCHTNAAVVFILLGCFAISVAIFRVWLGPPVLTSWMGQHVYLARTEAISLSGDVLSLASGYEVAKQDLGRLRLSTQKGEESGAMLEHDNSTDSERQSTKERGEEAGEVNGVRLPSEYQDN